jgi:hypothetical protein
LKSWKWQHNNFFKQSIIDSNTVRFLNETGIISNATDWNNPDKSKLWVYNLHYFDDLNSEDFFNRKIIHYEIMRRWIDENPPCIGNGWEPYPLSLRLVNWIKWLSKKDVVEKSFF